jgi:hypothetical protein
MSSLSRRNFMKTASAFSAGAVFIPHLISCSPSKKLNIAVVGVGGRGKANWSSCPEENIVALCDVDENRAAEGFSTFPNARRFKDFRKMFDEMGGEIDAVLISTPDHTHFAATMAAMQLGKHVYVEKPLAHNVWQLRTLKKAARHYNVITQMGNQGHTTDGIRRVKEWVDAGVIGEVREVLAWFNGPEFGEDKFFTKPAQFPPAEENSTGRYSTGIYGWGLLPGVRTTMFIIPNHGAAFTTLAMQNWAIGPATHWMPHSGRWNLECPQQPKQLLARELLKVFCPTSLSFSLSFLPGETGLL